MRDAVNTGESSFQRKHKSSRSPSPEGISDHGERELVGESEGTHRVRVEACRAGDNRNSGKSDREISSRSAEKEVGNYQSLKTKVESRSSSSAPKVRDHHPDEDWQSSINDHPSSRGSTNRPRSNNGEQWTETSPNLFANSERHRSSPGRASDEVGSPSSISHHEGSTLHHRSKSSRRHNASEPRERSVDSTTSTNVFIDSNVEGSSRHALEHHQSAHRQHGRSNDNEDEEKSKISTQSPSHKHRSGVGAERENMNEKSMNYSTTLIGKANDGVSGVSSRHQDHHADERLSNAPVSYPPEHDSAAARDASRFSRLETMIELGHRRNHDGNFRLGRVSTKASCMNKDADALSISSEPLQSPASRGHHDSTRLTRRETEVFPPSSLTPPAHVTWGLENEHFSTRCRYGTPSTRHRTASSNQDGGAEGLRRSIHGDAHGRSHHGVRRSDSGRHCSDGLTVLDGKENVLTEPVGCIQRVQDIIGSQSSKENSKHHTRERRHHHHDTADSSSRDREYHRDEDRASPGKKVGRRSEADAARDRYSLSRTRVRNSSLDAVDGRHSDRDACVNQRVEVVRDGNSPRTGLRHTQASGNGKHLHSPNDGSQHEKGKSASGGGERVQGSDIYVSDHGSESNTSRSRHENDDQYRRRVHDSRGHHDATTSRSGRIQEEDNALTEDRYRLECLGKGSSSRHRRDDDSSRHRHRNHSSGNCERTSGLRHTASRLTSQVPEGNDSHHAGGAHSQVRHDDSRNDDIVRDRSRSRSHDEHGNRGRSDSRLRHTNGETSHHDEGTLQEMPNVHDDDSPSSAHDGSSSRRPRHKSTSGDLRRGAEGMYRENLDGDAKPRTGRHHEGSHRSSNHRSTHSDTHLSRSYVRDHSEKYERNTRNGGEQGADRHHHKDDVVNEKYRSRRPHDGDAGYLVHGNAHGERRHEKRHIRFSDGHPMESIEHQHQKYKQKNGATMCHRDGTSSSDRNAFSHTNSHRHHRSHHHHESLNTGAVTDKKHNTDNGHGDKTFHLSHRQSPVEDNHDSDYSTSIGDNGGPLHGASGHRFVPTLGPSASADANIARFQPEEVNSRTRETSGAEQRQIYADAVDSTKSVTASGDIDDQGGNRGRIIPDAVLECREYLLASFPRRANFW